MTNQEIFDKVWDIFIIKKIGPSYDGSICIYDEKINGHGCAVGCLLPDDIPVDLLDQGGGRTIASIIDDRPTELSWKKQCPPIRKLLRDISVDFLKTLQQAHDGNASSKDFSLLMTQDLIGIAKKFNLKYPQ